MKNSKMYQNWIKQIDTSEIDYSNFYPNKDLKDRIDSFMQIISLMNSIIQKDTTRYLSELSNQFTSTLIFNELIAKFTIKNNIFFISFLDNGKTDNTISLEVSLNDFYFDFECSLEILYDNVLKIVRAKIEKND